MLIAVKTNAINYAKDQISLVRIEEDYFNFCINFTRNIVENNKILFILITFL